MIKSIISLLKYRFFCIYWRLNLLIHRCFNRELKELRGRSLFLPLASPMLTSLPIQHGNGKSILFAIYWYELGGAESYALMTIRHAKELGFRIYVVSDLPADDRDFEKFDVLADESFRASKEGDVDALLDIALHRKVDILHIHHNRTAYRALPLLKEKLPDLHVVDSLHLVEYWGGGFPALACRYDRWISVHNVISHSLAEYIVAHIEPADAVSAKIKITYLAPSGVPAIKPIDLTKKKTISILFYARLVTQKQPYVFTHVIKKLNEHVERESLPFKFKGVIMGEGEGEAQLKRYHQPCLDSGELEFKGRLDNKDQVYSETDILAITSINEGITLTSFEALMRGVPVISFDVGAQRELLPQGLLVDLWVSDPVDDFVGKVIEFVSQPATADSWMQDAVRKLEKLQQSAYSINALSDCYNQP